VYVYIYVYIWLILWLYIESCQIIRQESILIACGVKIGLGGTLGASIIYIVFLGSHTAPKKLFWTFKKEELYMNDYRNGNLDFIRKSKILRKEKEPTYYSGQIYYTYI